MEAVAMTPHQHHQSIAPSSNNNNNNKKQQQIRIKTPNPKRNGGGQGGNFIYKNPSPSETLDTYSAAGLLNPPSRAMSLCHTLFTHQHQHQQPPLLPLPNVSSSIHHHQPLLSRSLSSTQGLSISRKDRSRDTSLTPKKSKPTKREEANKRSISDFLIVANSDNRWGPDPKDLPKHLPVVLSPPPSSLPLPKFSSLRSKLSCNAEAAGGVDAGATNNLRRLLRLR